MSAADRWQSLKTLFRQFRLPFALRLLAADAMRKLLDPHAILSYAQTGEDRLIDFFVGYPQTGFYVDVGCNDPIVGSNTFRLYRRGWRGLCIDPNASCIARFRKVRPRDIAVEAAVSYVEGELEYTEFSDSTISSVSPEFRPRRCRGSPRVVARRKVCATTLSALCHRYAVPSRFELLSVDCEGHDLQVLKSLDFLLYRPKVIVVEVFGSHPEDAERHPVGDYLAEKGYRLRAYATLNGYFLDEK